MLFPPQDLVSDLKEKLSDHFKDVMVGLMYPPPSYDAHELWHAMKVEVRYGNVPEQVQPEFRWSRPCSVMGEGGGI